MSNLFRTFRPAYLVLISIASASALFCFQVVTRPPDVFFEKHTIDLGSSESAAIADINGDGKLDIVSGENWYEAPRWQKHHFRDILYTNNYIDDLSTLALDVDGDGRVDLVTSGWFSKKLAWWKNPGRTSGKWVETPASKLRHPLSSRFWSIWTTTAKHVNSSTIWRREAAASLVRAARRHTDQTRCEFSQLWAWHRRGRRERRRTKRHSDASRVA